MPQCIWGGPRKTWTVDSPAFPTWAPRVNLGVIRFGIKCPDWLSHFTGLRFLNSWITVFTFVNAVLDKARVGFTHVSPLSSLPILLFSSGAEAAALWLNTFSGFQRHVFFTGLLYNFAADNSSPQAWIYSPVEMTLPQAFSQSTMEMKGDNGVLSTRLEIQWLFNKLQQW